jgi:[FeFe] hydrogenase (group B1/B3)
MKEQFESNIQEIKYKILKAAARYGFSNLNTIDRDSISEKIIPGPKPSFRCCIYKEREIIKERLSFALDEPKNKNIVRVIEKACDQCPIDRYTVTNSCRGCIARSCENACPVDAIHIIGQRAYINQEKCIECGRCKEACSFNAISDTKRPCKRSCPVDAIEMDENKIASINYDKCIACGHCVYSCPFGAITDKSYIYEVAKKLSNQNNQMYALIAPSISSQFDQTTIGQITTALKSIGFTDVIEVALGADIIIKEETTEYISHMKDHSFMTTSCCPAFFNLVHKYYPSVADNMSTTISPMAALGKLVKHMHKDATTVFFGPCIGKKDEALKDHVKDYIDYVLTFEELRSLFGAKEIDVSSLEPSPLNNASYYGRMFAVSTGVSNSIKAYIDDNQVDVEFKPLALNGAKECITALKKAKFNKLDHTFLEGMVCEGGCIGGPGSLTHRKKDANEVKKFAKEAMEKSTKDALELIDISSLSFHR